MPGRFRAAGRTRGFRGNLNKSELALLDSMMKYTPPRCIQGQLIYNEIPRNSFKCVEDLQSNEVMIRTDDG